jgi:hypothetical protein
VTVPSVAIELNTDVHIETALAYADTEVSTTSNTPSVSAKVAVSTGVVEAEVREYFADIPVMIDIARCESHFTQTNPVTGNVQRGRVNSADLGVMQINEKYHASTAKNLGLDLHTLSGNMAYARYLYRSQGTQPWSASRYCWQKSDGLAVR